MQLRGIIPPVVTPMTADQELDLPGLRSQKADGTRTGGCGRMAQSRRTSDADEEASGLEATGQAEEEAG